MNIVLAGDVGPEVGLGHRRRLEAIGTALTDLGYPWDFVAISDPDDGDVWGQDLAVVDSYITRADRQALYEANVIVAIDELGRNLGVDLVIDPTPRATPPGSSRAKRTLAGTDFVLVDPRLRALDPRPEQAVERILVTLGASPAAGHVREVAVSLAAAHPDLDVRVALGPWFDPAGMDGVEIVDAPDGLAEALAAADLVVTAGGVTMLEACVLGRPTIVLPIAPNQQRAVDALGGLGAVVVARAETVVDTVGRLIEDDAERTALGCRARASVDGRGAERAAAAIVELLGQRS